MLPTHLPRPSRGRLVAASALLAVSAATGLTAGPAAGAGATVIRVPVDSRLFLPCANGGTGEVVHFTGMILGVSTGGANGAGGFHAVSVEVEQGVKGVGETTGRRYVEQFVNLFSSSSGAGGSFESTQQEIYRVNSSGPGFDSVIRIRNHTTINPDGTTTVTFDNETMECLATSP
jgi:hypothetical protein